MPYGEISSKSSIASTVVLELYSAPIESTFDSVIVPAKGQEHQWKTCGFVGDFARSLSLYANSLDHDVSTFSSSLDASIADLPDIAEALSIVDDLFSKSQPFASVDAFSSATGVLRPNASRLEQEQRLYATNVVIVHGIIFGYLQPLLVEASDLAASICNDIQSLQNNAALINVDIFGRSLPPYTLVFNTARPCEIIADSIVSSRDILVLRDLYRYLGGDYSKLKTLLSQQQGSVTILITKTVKTSAIVDSKGLRYETIQTLSDKFGVPIYPEDVVIEGDRTVVFYESVVGINENLNTVSKRTGIPIDQLSVKVLHLDRNSGVVNESPYIETIGFNGNLLSSSAFNLTVVVNGNTFVIDITGNQGQTPPYSPDVIASTINAQIGDLLCRQVNKELSFQTRGSGFSESISFKPSSANDAAYVLGLVEAQKQAIKSTKLKSPGTASGPQGSEMLIVWVNQKTKKEQLDQPAPDYIYKNTVTGVITSTKPEDWDIDEDVRLQWEQINLWAQTTVKFPANAKTLKDLPEIIWYGGNPGDLGGVSRFALLQMQAAGLNNDQITAILTNSPYIDIRSVTIQQQMIELQGMLNRIQSNILANAQKLQLTKVFSSKFNSLLSDLRFRILHQSDSKILEKLESKLTPAQIKELLLLRDDLVVFSVDSDTSQVIDELTTAISTNAPGSYTFSSFSLGSDARSYPSQESAAVHISKFVNVSSLLNAEAAFTLLIKQSEINFGTLGQMNNTIRMIATVVDETQAAVNAVVQEFQRKTSVYITKVESLATISYDLALGGDLDLGLIKCSFGLDTSINVNLNDLLNKLKVQIQAILDKLADIANSARDAVERIICKAMTVLNSVLAPINSSLGNIQIPCSIVIDITGLPQAILDILYGMVSSLNFMVTLFGIVQGNVTLMSSNLNLTRTNLASAISGVTNCIEPARPIISTIRKGLNVK